MRAALVLLAVVSVLAGAEPLRSRAGGDDTRRAVAEIRAIGSPAGPGSGQPQLSTSARGTLLSWVERRGSRASLRFATRTATGWTPARTVASGNNWFVNWADVPSVVRLPGGSLAAHWLQRSGPERYAYDVRLSHSRDDGQTWAPSFTPHDDGTKTEHGFASLFATPDGGLGVAWLDGRNTHPTATHGDGQPRGAMTVRVATYDGQWRRTRDEAIDVRACDCCPTSVVVTSDGPVAAWRDRTEHEVRDIVVSRLEAGRWTTPKPVHADGWRIEACPVNGPMLAARGRDVVVAWFTAVGEVGHAYVAFSSDAARSFGAPVRLDDTAALGRVAVAWLPDGRALASWVDLQGTAATFAIRAVSPAGSRSAVTAVTRLDSSRSSGYPRLAVHDREVLFAWTDSRGSTTAVRTASARLP